VDRLGDHGKVDRITFFTVESVVISGNCVFLRWHIEIGTCTTFPHESSHAHKASCIVDSCVLKGFSLNGHLVGVLAVEGVGGAGANTDATMFAVTKLWSLIESIGFERSVGDYCHESLSRPKLGCKKEAAKAELTKTSGYGGVAV